MTYKDKLNPWCIIRPVSSVQIPIVGRFRRRSDAVCVREASRREAWCVSSMGHIQILKRLIPDVPFEIMFDIATEDLIPQPPSLQGKGEYESSSLLLAGEGLGERSTQK